MRKDNNKGIFWLRTLLVIIAVVLHQIFLPWWGMIVACILCGYLTAPMSRYAFLAGFVAVFITWGFFALYLDLQNNSVLSSRVIRLFPLPEWPAILVLITALLGGLAGGFACKTGDQFRRLFLRKKAVYY